MKRINYGIIVLCVFLSGCGITQSDNFSSVLSEQQSESCSNETLSETSISNTKKFPNHYELHDGNVTFDCKVIAPETVALYKTTAIPLTVDENAVLDFFGGFDMNADYKEYETWDNGVLKQYKKDQRSLSITDTSCLYFDYDLSYGNSLRINDEYMDNRNGDLYLSGKELNFSSIPDAQNDLYNMLTLFVPELDDIEYTVYTCDMQILQEEYLAVLDEMGTDEPTSAGYYVAARQELQGIPVFVLTGGVLYFDSDDNTPISMYLTEDGIGEFNISDLYQFEESDELLKLLPFDDIAGQIMGYYNRLITEDSYEVYQARLYNYVLPNEQGNYEVTPVWIFKLRQNAPDGSYQFLQKELNAVTGEEFRR